MILRRPRVLFVLCAAAALVSLLAIFMDWSAPARAGLIAVFCLWLWLTEWVPLWLPTVILWIAVPLLLAGFGSLYSPLAVLQWSADPVLPLFFGGFALAAAARRWDLDQWLVTHAVRLARGETGRLIVIVAFTTTGLSMWMSNIAAAALVLGALSPLLTATTVEDSSRRALLLTVALSANVGGVATPVGSGPNGIAVAAVAHAHSIGFLDWMAFGVPLAVGLVVVVVMMVRMRVDLPSRFDIPTQPTRTLTQRAWMVCTVLVVTIALWLTESFHGWPTWIIALGAVGMMIILGLVRMRDLQRLDWSTLLLIAGGIGLGTLLERAGIVHVFTAWLSLDGVPRTVVVFCLCLVSACSSALMSNTATAAWLIPVALTIDPSPSTAVLIAIATSLGVPFVISTPPNAMAVARGLPSRDLLIPGLLLLIGGCALVALTGPAGFHHVGIP